MAMTTRIKLKLYISDLNFFTAHLETSRWPRSHEGQQQT